MTLAERLSEYISACFTGLWLQSHEHEDAIAEIAELCRKENWHLAIWDVEQGLQIPGQANGQALDAGGSDPLAAIRAINALAAPNSSAILVLVNFHRFLNSPEIIQAVAKQILAGKNNRTFLVILSSLVQIPPELEKQIIVVEHELPTREQLRKIMFGIATGEGEQPDEPELQTVLDAAAGLTRVRSRGSLQFVACASWPRRGRGRVGIEIPDAQEKRSSLPASWHRVVCQPRWPGRDEEFLPPGNPFPGTPRSIDDAHAGFYCWVFQAVEKVLLPKPWGRKREDRH